MATDDAQASHSILARFNDDLLEVCFFHFHASITRLACDAVKSLKDDIVVRLGMRAAAQVFRLRPSLCHVQVL
jgi:hypothetical protein